VSRCDTIRYEQSVRIFVVDVDEAFVWMVCCFSLLFERDVLWLVQPKTKQTLVWIVVGKESSRKVFRRRLMMLVSARSR